MSCCCVPECKSYKRKKDCGNKTFHRFPVNPEIRRQWLVNTRRETVPNFLITENTRVCSDHFTRDCFSKTITGISKLNEGSMPTVFAWSTTKSGWSEVISTSDGAAVTCGHDAPEEDLSSTLSFNPVHASLPYPDHDYNQKFLSLEEELEETHKMNECQEEEFVKLRNNRFFLRRYQCDDRQIMFYTGFKDYNTLMAVFIALQPTAENMSGWSEGQRLKQVDKYIARKGFKEQRLPLIEQFFLFLCRLRQGFSVQHLATRFNVSQVTVHTICITWTNFLYYMLGSIPIWPSRETIHELMPQSVKDTFPRARVILDCAELHVEKASSEVLTSETYSYDKETTTLKSLIGISPSGALTFVSHLYMGSVSGKEITKLSGILSLLEEGDEVLAGEGFHIDDLLSVINVSLVTPPSLKLNRRLREVLQTQEIDRLRIHVERAIRRIKEYHIFDKPLAMTTMGSINKVWKVCALLTTFQGPLI